MAQAWEELCRAAIPWLHRSDNAVARYGPFEDGKRFWFRNDPEFDVVARSMDGERLLVGEVRLGRTTGIGGRIQEEAIRGTLPNARDCELIRVIFVPEADSATAMPPEAVVVDARNVLEALR